MNDFHELETELSLREQRGQYRRRRIVQSPQGREILVDDRWLLNFCSNDYLGLANEPRVRAAFVKGAEQWGAGSGASHLVCGHTKAHEQLEEALAEFTGRPRCLLFSSGYAANVGVINSLLGNKDSVLQDRLNHASMIDGGLISGARLRRYAHRDIEDLQSKLSASRREGRRLIVSDGTFSMDGTTCDIRALSKLAARHDAWLMIDEAHSLGVLGANGRGLIDPQQFSCDDVQIVIGTLGKALGTQGGFVAGSEQLIEYLIQSARTYIYTTAVPAAVAVATLTSLQLAQSEEERRERLQQRIRQFRTGAGQLGLQLIDSATPIQPIIIGGDALAMRVSRKLEERGLLISAIRPPTVPRGSARLRITLTAAHEENDVQRLLAALEELQPVINSETTE